MQDPFGACDNDSFNIKGWTHNGSDKTVYEETVLSEMKTVVALAHDASDRLVSDIPILVTTIVVIQIVIVMIIIIVIIITIINVTVMIIIRL